MHDINPQAFNFREVALAAVITMGLVGAVDLLSGCSTTPQPPPPSYAEVAAPAPAPSAPKITGAMILARQPKEVQDAIQHYQEGSWPTYRNTHGMLVPYAERMDPVQIDCAPNYHVDIYLLPGETPTGVAAGDSERWVIGAATDSAQGGNAVVYVKCKDTNLSGDASVFTSVGRTYPLLLRSKARSQLRWVRFYDPETVLAQMRAADAAPATAPDPDPIAPAPGTKLNVAYSVSGPNVAWRPQRAFDDGAHVWIQMPTMSSPVRPILLGDDLSQLNYRVRGQYFETDSLFSKATLVANNQKVLIERSGQ
jgi:P-type conjugative transfer protein TrbG